MDQSRYYFGEISLKLPKFLNIIAIVFKPSKLFLMSRKLVELLVKERLISESQNLEAEQIFRAGGDAIRQLIDKKNALRIEIALFFKSEVLDAKY